MWELPEAAGQVIPTNRAMGQCDLCSPWDPRPRTPAAWLHGATTVPTGQSQHYCSCRGSRGKCRDKAEVKQSREGAQKHLQRKEGGKEGRKRPCRLQVLLADPNSSSPLSPSFYGGSSSEVPPLPVPSPTFYPPSAAKLPLSASKPGISCGLFM